MARARAERHAQGGSAARRKKSGSAAGRQKSRPTTGRKKSPATGRKSRPAGGRTRRSPRTGSRRGAAGSPLGVLLTAVGVLAAIAVLGLAGWLLTFPLDDARYSSGLSGTPGTFTAARCHTAGSGTPVCTGTFVPAKSGLVDRNAHVRDARIQVGRPASLRRRPDGGYVQPGPAKTGKDLATAFGIISLAAFLLVLLCAAPKRVSAGGWKRMRKNPPPWGTLLTIVVPLFGASLLLAGLCLLVGFLLSHV
ncbi:hypothetical protein [Actinoallomurus sp. CA-150999]|uniref:hypothetical protein n=1 Tax=Actinoallomurus sp. CA-150999 TaxID=3239887 RepID=UPI003D921632